MILNNKKYEPTSMYAIPKTTGRPFESLLDACAFMEVGESLEIDRQLDGKWMDALKEWESKHEIEFLIDISLNRIWRVE